MKQSWFKGTGWTQTVAQQQGTAAPLPPHHHPRAAERQAKQPGRRTSPAAQRSPGAGSGAGHPTAARGA